MAGRVKPRIEDDCGVLDSTFSAQDGCSCARKVADAFEAAVPKPPEFHRLRSIASVKMGRMTEVTQLLNAIGQGEKQASAELLPLVYEELRNLAAQKLCQEKPGQTLQGTALVHEAYLRLLGPTDGGPGWNGRGHFFAAAAEAMRRILVEQARRKNRVRHGGELRRVDFDS